MIIKNNLEDTKKEKQKKEAKTEEDSEAYFQS